MKKKKQNGTMSLFEPPSPPAVVEPTREERPSTPSDPTACPKCGGKSLVSNRATEYGGRTHYCTRCAGDESGEPFRFTPNAALSSTASSEEEAPVEVSASKYDQEKLFTGAVVPATGKTIEALEYSRERATEVMRMFDGHLPQSIMKAEKKSRGAADLATGSYSATEKYSGAFAKSSSGCAYGALSAFPQNIGKACLLLYTEPLQVVFDPFAGHNSRMEFCVRAGRHYIGCDISKKFMQFNRERAEKLRAEFPEIRIALHEIDSRHLDAIELQEQADFTITSPPYYDIEDYGDEYQQLGKCSSNYFEFCKNMEKVACGNYAKLKQGSFCVWFVNDFRREGAFHAYHINTFNMLREAGFKPWDMMITDFGGSFGQCFPAQVVDRKILPKRHEYGVIMRKL